MGSTKQATAIFSLALVLFIDTLGFSLLYPILVPVFQSSDIGIFPSDVSIQWRHFCYGLTLSLFPLMTFFSAPILGDWSDFAGRRKGLFLCLSINALSYILVSLGIYWKSFFLILIGRIIAGISVGSQSIAQAAIADVSTPKNKAQNLSYMTLAISLGYVSGPLVGGFLSDSKILPWFNLTTPLLLASLLVMVNIIFLFFSFSETRPPQGFKMKLDLLKSFHSLKPLWQHKELFHILMVFFLSTFAWNIYFSYIPVYLTGESHLTSLDLSVFLTATSFGFILASVILIRLFSKIMPGYKMVAPFAISCFTVYFLAQIAGNNFYILIPTAILSGISFGTLYAQTLSIFSNQVSSNQQGWIMGVCNAVYSLSCFIAALGGGMLYAYNPRLPSICAMILSGTAAFWALVVHTSWAKGYQENHIEG